MQQLTLFPETQFDWTTDDWQTPTDLAKKIAGLVTDSDRVILEPAAGSGQIAQFLPQGSWCVESNLQRVAQGKLKAPQCRWINDSFLNQIELFPDLIIGNPPFSQKWKFIEWGLEILNPCNDEARILFLLPIDFNCGIASGNYWSKLDCYIHHEYRIQNRVAYLDSNGKPQTGRQIYDAVFDIRSGTSRTITFL